MNTCGAELLKPEREKIPFIFSNELVCRGNGTEYMALIMSPFCVMFVDECMTAGHDGARRRFKLSRKGYIHSLPYEARN